MYKILSFILFVTIVQQSTLACSCSDYLIDLPIKEMGWMAKQSDDEFGFQGLIFTGILVDTSHLKIERQNHLKTKTKETKIELTFKLIKSYKGNSNDTIKILTNYGSDACGFWSPLYTESIIFAFPYGNGYYLTMRSDCCKSISKAYEEKRYEKYITFLDSISEGIDGEYVFKQTDKYWKEGFINQEDTLDLIRYEVKNGKLDGLWELKDRRGRVHEKGFYKEGKKVGEWVLCTYEGEFGDYRRTIVRKIQYEQFRPVREETSISRVVGDPLALPNENVKETIINTYEYYD